VEDGFFRLWQDGVLRGEKATFSWGSQVCAREGYEFHDEKVIQYGLVYNGALTGQNYIPWEDHCDRQTDVIYHDDTVYQIGTWARVILCDAQEWDDCTVREYQPVLEWFNTSIEFAVNLGAFSQGETAWLYVVDDNGVSSTGIEVVIGVQGRVGDLNNDGQINLEDIALVTSFQQLILIGRYFLT
jgi:hypothetical protein